MLHVTVATVPESMTVAVIQNASFLRPHNTGARYVIPAGPRYRWRGGVVVGKFALH